MLVKIYNIRGTLNFEKYETIIYDVSGIRRYSPVEENQNKKHKIHPMETTKN